MSIVYFILAALGLGFLIFIHELGHYFMARRVGMTVEVFSIGFGKPIFSWMWQNVKWQLCWIPFGGYVRIAGTEKKGHLEPHQIPDGFFGKRPIDRIKVSVMGPLVNIVFAFLAFTAIWMSGGREKSFSEYTHRLGWVDPESRLYEMGIRPGDEITSYNGRSFEGIVDLFYGALKNGNQSDVKGIKINYATGAKEPFAYELASQRLSSFSDAGIPTLGVISPASYLIYHPSEEMAPHSPMEHSGIQKGDRILAVDGQIIFSLHQLTEIVNEPKVFLTVQRGNTIFQTRIPRLKISDLRLGDGQRTELEDWKHEAQLKGKWSQLYFIPYNITNHAVIEAALPFLDHAAREKTYVPSPRSAYANPLEKGDQILAVDGVAVNSGEDVLSALQKRRVHMIVERGLLEKPVLWKEADQAFESSIAASDIEKITATIGTTALLHKSGSLVLLNPIEPVSAVDFPVTPATKAKFTERWTTQKEEIEKIADPKQREKQLTLLEKEKNRLKLGIGYQSLANEAVIYNPNPFVLFGDVLEQTWVTFSALFSGGLSPKFLQGPVGIFQVMQHGWSQGFNEALFWIGLISINLGIFNLLPIPILDGGYICFALWELITKKPIPARIIERMLIPFLVLLIGFMLFVTYHDIIRLFLHR